MRLPFFGRIQKAGGLADYVTLAFIVLIAGAMVVGLLTANGSSVG